MYNYLVEFIGTIFFVYVILTTKNPLAIGAALALALLLTVSVSGGYFNPAITIAMVSLGTLPTTDLVPYCLAQVFGALVALELHERFKL
jgi:glycerol uptake facilitator-like aquaporin